MPITTLRRLFLALFLIASGSGATGQEAQDALASATECCFANPKYAGVCAVNGKEEESCASILEYLNSPTGSGKSYCRSTEIRGGWEETRCSTVVSGPSRPGPNADQEPASAGRLCGGRGVSG